MKVISTSIFAAATIIGFASQTLACAYQASQNDDQYLTSTMKDNGKETCHINGYGDNTGYTYNCISGHSLRCNNSLNKCTYKSPNGSFTFSAGNGTPECFPEGGCVTTYTANPKCI